MIMHLKATNGIKRKNARPWLKTIFRLLPDQHFIGLFHNLISTCLEAVKIGSTLSVFHPLCVKLEEFSLAIKAEKTNRPSSGASECS